MADPLSTAAGIIALLQLTEHVVSYIRDVKSAARDRCKLLEELQNTISLLHLLRDTTERVKRHSPRSPALSMLSSSSGALEQFRLDLEDLARRLAPVQGTAKLKKIVAWPISKTKINEIFNRIERLKSSLVLVLEQENMQAKIFSHGGVLNLTSIVISLKQSIGPYRASILT